MIEYLLYGAIALIVLFILIDVFGGWIMNILIIVITVLMVVLSILISFKVFDITNKEILELSEHNSEVRYGLFYNSLIEDVRSFTLGEIVWFHDQKYYIVSQSTDPYKNYTGVILLHLSKDLYYFVASDNGGLIVDSRKVKKVLRGVCK